MLGSFFGGRSIFVERRDIFDCHTFDRHAPDHVSDVDAVTVAESSASTRVCIDVADIELPALFQDAAPPQAGVLVCAKHLCGVGTDLALDCIERARYWPHLRCILIAPCCHQTISWNALPESFRQWFLDRGFESSWWNLFKLLVHVSKSSKPNGHFGSFSALSDVSPLKLYALGRLARRCIEEARCFRLRSLGFFTRIYRYSPSAVTPDNLVIVSQQMSTHVSIFQHVRMPSAVCPMNAPNTRAGVVLRLECCDRARSIVARLYSSHRQVKAQSGAGVMFDVAFEQTLYLRKESLERQGSVLALGDYEVVVVVNCASYTPLLASLVSDRVLRCAIRQIIPFCCQSSSVPVLQLEALSILSKKTSDHRKSSVLGGDFAPSVRLLCWPPSLLDEMKLAADAAAESPFDAAIPSAKAAACGFPLKLHPTLHSAVLCAVDWTSLDCASVQICRDEVFQSYGRECFDTEHAHQVAVESKQLQRTDSRFGSKYVLLVICF